MSSPMWDLPDHVPIGVDATGNGPVDDSDPSCVGLNCWCKWNQPWPCPDNKEL